MGLIKEEKGQGYALVIKPREDSSLQSKEKIEEPLEVLMLLDKYQDIVVIDTPYSLPPMRDIGLQIDLIPWETLPNKIVYKMTPSQNEEIAKNVQELLDNSLIRKSLSPCVVPIVLAPKKDGK